MSNHRELPVFFIGRLPVSANDISRIEGWHGDRVPAVILTAGWEDALARYGYDEAQLRQCCERSGMTVLDLSKGLPCPTK